MKDISAILQSSVIIYIYIIPSGSQTNPQVLPPPPQQIITNLLILVYCNTKKGHEESNHQSKNGQLRKIVGATDARVEAVRPAERVKPTTIRRRLEVRNNVVVRAEEFSAGAELDREFVVENEHAVLVAGALKDVEADVTGHGRDTAAAPGAVDADVVVVGE